MTGLAQSWRTRSENGLPGFTLAPLWTWADMWRTMHQRSLDGFIVSPSFFDKLAGTDEVRLALENQAPWTHSKQRGRRTMRRSSSGPNPICSTLGMHRNLGVEQDLMVYLHMRLSFTHMSFLAATMSALALGCTVTTPTRGRRSIANAETSIGADVS